jgi:hypothetical protein
MSTTFSEKLKDPCLQSDLKRLEKTDPEAHQTLMSMYQTTIDNGNPLQLTPQQLYDDFVGSCQFVDDNNRKKEAEENAKLTLTRQKKNIRVF